jgi:ankyrin repeat protein
VAKPWEEFWKQSKAMIDDLIDRAQRGDLAGVEEILKKKSEIYVDINVKYPFLYNQRDIDQMTPLHFACDGQYVQIAKLLVQHDCEIDP